MFSVPQGLESGLSRELEGLEYEAEEIDLQGLDARLDDGSVLREDPKPKPGKQQHQQPGDGGIGNAHHCVEPDAGFDPGVLLGAVIVADHRLGAAADAGNRQGENLPNGVGDGHDAHIHIAAEMLQSGVAGHLHQAVGALHDEIDGAHFADFLGDISPDGDIFPAQRNQRLFAQEKPQNPGSRGCLADHRGKSRTCDSHIQSENKDGIQNNIAHGSDGDGVHTHFWETLGVDITVEARGEHGERCAGEIEIQIVPGIDEGSLAGTEGKENGLHKEVADGREDHGAAKEQSERIA